MKLRLTSRLLAAVLTLVAASAFADEAADLYQQVASGRCSPAMATLKSRAADGDAAFQYQRALTSYFGKCSNKSPTEAASWFLKAAEQGHADAQFNLGIMYANGEGVAKDPREAVAWYRKAAEQGHADAQNNLGAAYEIGSGILQDFTLAARWYEVAARQGDAWGQRNLALLLRDGRGVAANPVLAHAWLNRASAADKPHPNAAEERDALAENLSAAQLADAQRLAREWKPGFAMGTPRVKVASSPRATPAPVAVPVSYGNYPARPAARPGVTTCNTQCNNGNCFRTYGDGRKTHFQAQRKFNPMNSAWEFDTGSC